MEKDFKAVMKTNLIRIFFGFVLLSCAVACSPRYGCPSDGRNVGAEKLLNEGKSKSPKFRG
jgi:hypothetical protein